MTTLGMPRWLEETPAASARFPATSGDGAAGLLPACIDRVLARDRDQPAHPSLLRYAHSEPSFMFLLEKLTRDHAPSEDTRGYPPHRNRLAYDA